MLPGYLEIGEKYTLSRILNDGRTADDGPRTIYVCLRRNPMEFVRVNKDGSLGKVLYRFTVEIVEDKVMAIEGKSSTNQNAADQEWHDKWMALQNDLHK